LTGRRLLSLGPEDVVPALYQQPAEQLVALAGDPKLRLQLSEPALDRPQPQARPDRRALWGKRIRIRHHEQGGQSGGAPEIVDRHQQLGLLGGALRPMALDTQCDQRSRFWELAEGPMPRFEPREQAVRPAVEAP
jgi:hypothetical protein